MARRRYTPKLRAQVVLDVLVGDKTPGQVAKAYGRTRIQSGTGSGGSSNGLQRSSTRPSLNSASLAGSGRHG